MTVEAATDYARGVHGFLQASSRTDDDLDVAYDTFERQFGVGRWTIEHLRKAKAKTCDVSIFAKLKGAYVTLIERQVSKLQHELTIEKATQDDDDLRALEADVAALAEKVKAKRAALKQRRPAIADDGFED